MTKRLGYQRYEYGEREPSFQKLIALADYFDVSLDYLVGRSDDPSRHWGLRANKILWLSHAELRNQLWIYLDTTSACYIHLKFWRFLFPPKWSWPCPSPYLKFFLLMLSHLLSGLKAWSSKRSPEIQQKRPVLWFLVTFIPEPENRFKIALRNSVFRVFAASSLAGSFPSSFSILVIFPKASEPNSTLYFPVPHKFRRER